MKSYFASQGKVESFERCLTSLPRLEFGTTRNCDAFNGEPFLVNTRVHDTVSNMGESTQTASIILEWADLVQKFNQPKYAWTAITWTMWGDNF